MARTALRAAAALLCLLAPLACGGDDGGGDDPEVVTEQGPDGRDDGEPRVRTEERTLATLRTLVVRPRGPGPFPLVVFVHGAGAPPEFYGEILEAVAAAGHVVVAPAMPGSVDRSDLSALLALPFQPGRAHQLIDAVTEGPDAIRAADPERVLVMGHSLGGMTALALGFHSCCDDARVDAVVSIAGQLATFPGGSFGSGTAPVLLVHGDDDEVVPYPGSGQALQLVGTSAYLLTVEGGDHGQYLGADDPAHPAVMASILAFARATVGGDPRGGVADLTAAGGRPGVRLTMRGG